AVEARGAEPVLPRELERVLHAHEALLCGVDEEQPAERPPGLAAEVHGRFLLDDEHALARVHQLRGGDQSREAGTDDDRIGVRGWGVARNGPCRLGLCWHPETPSFRVLRAS